MSGNKGEWSELYAFMKLLSQGRVYAANEKVEKIDDVFYPILKIMREEQKGHTIDYVITDENVNIEVGYFFVSPFLFADGLLLLANVL